MTYLQNPMYPPKHVSGSSCTSVRCNGIKYILYSQNNSNPWIGVDLRAYSRLSTNRKYMDLQWKNVGKYFPKPKIMQNEKCYLNYKSRFLAFLSSLIVRIALWILCSYIYYSCKIFNTSLVHFPYISLNQHGT